MFRATVPLQAMTVFKACEIIVAIEPHFLSCIFGLKERHGLTCLIPVMQHIEIVHLAAQLCHRLMNAQDDVLQYVELELAHMM